MKKLTALLLTILFTLSTCTAALAWNCPTCGTEGSGNFCAECGTKRPEETICPTCGANYGSEKPNFCAECGTRLADAAPTEPPAEAEQEYLATSDYGVNIVSIQMQENGQLTLTWEDQNNNAPYKVRFLSVTTGDFDTDWDTNLVRLEVEGLTDTSYTYRYLVPGQPYWLAVTNGDGQGVYYQYESEPAKAFADFAIDPSVQPILRQGDGETENDINVSSFSAAEIGLGTSKHGLYFELGYPQLDSRKEYTAQVVMTDPNGFALVDSVSTMPFEVYEGGGCRYWNFYSLEWYFNALGYQYDSLPTGEYTVSVYLDGALAASANFTVTE